MSKPDQTWCDKDNHKAFECFSDFNDWLDSAEDDHALGIVEEKGISGFAQPSKALFAGDYEAYNQVFQAYRVARRHISLSRDAFNNFEHNDHWYERNEEHFNQLLECLAKKEVVPFIGAGVSVSAGFPTWKEHLRQQGITAGILRETIEEYLAAGEYELVLEEIEKQRGRDVFIQEIKDVFSKNGSLQSIVLILSELFSDTLITTNYDRLLEQVYSTGAEKEIQILTNVNPLEERELGVTSLLKLHGDIRTPKKCILSKAQYDEAYGKSKIDWQRPIPKALRYYFTSSSLFFIGCSLNNDRTYRLFAEIKSSDPEFDYPAHFTVEQLPESERETADRNAQLLKAGITPIWYERGNYSLVEEFLKQAQNELRYLRAL